MTLSIARIAVSATAGLVMLAGTSAVATGTAEASPVGPLCNVNQNTWVFDEPRGDRIYTIPEGGGFRLHALVGGYALGHGNGHSDGWILDDGRIVNCH